MWNKSVSGFKCDVGISVRNGTWTLALRKDAHHLSGQYSHQYIVREGDLRKCIALQILRYITCVHTKLPMEG